MSDADGAIAVFIVSVAIIAYLGILLFALGLIIAGVGAVFAGIAKIWQKLTGGQ